MKYAVIDTETSGLFRFRDDAGNPVPADAEGQPRLAHLAMILLADDLSEESAVEYFVKPDGWEVDAGAVAVNGLTTEILNEKGVPVKDVLDAYTKVVNDGYVIVAFNAQFDTKVMRGELRRAEMDDLFTRTPNICVMRASTDICKVPKKSGVGYKFPKLSEACEHFKIENDGAHTAMSDARAALGILRQLLGRGACPAPAVHFATNRPMPEKAVI